MTIILHNIYPGHTDIRQVLYIPSKQTVPDQNRIWCDNQQGSSADADTCCCLSTVTYFSPRTAICSVVSVFFIWQRRCCSSLGASTACGKWQIGDVIYCISRSALSFKYIIKCLLIKYFIVSKCALFSGLQLGSKTSLQKLTYTNALEECVALDIYRTVSLSSSSVQL